MEEVQLDIRLRVDGLFKEEKHAIGLTEEFTALYINRPARGGGIRHKREILLEKGLVGHGHIYWNISAKQNQPTISSDQNSITPAKTTINHPDEFLTPKNHLSLAPSDQKILLYEIAHVRAGDKGIFVMRDSSWMFLSHPKYATKILKQDHMVNCNSSKTPVDTESKLGNVGDLVSDLTLYQSLSGSLEYLTFTRPNIAYAV
nr:ribonuclease H-like domain-containing protein [Tanacetum cinerariifolium]